MIAIGNRRLDRRITLTAGDEEGQQKAAQRLAGKLREGEAPGREPGWLRRGM